MASTPTPNPTCPFGCPEAIIQRGKRIIELEEALKKARDMHTHILDKYGRVKGDKIKADERRDVCEALLFDVLEENERLQREIEDRRNHLGYHGGAAGARTFGMRPTTIYTLPYVNEHPVPGVETGSQDLARKLVECLAEANRIAQELERREKLTGVKMQGKEGKRGL